MTQTDPIFAGPSNEPIFAGYTERQLEAAFRTVADPTDWRGRIDAEIEPAEYPVTAAAVTFYTATELLAGDINESTGKLQVRSIGYRHGPAGP